MYYLIYNLADGRYVKVFNHDLLSADKVGRYPRRTTEVMMYDKQGKFLNQSFYIDVLTDEQNGKLYFMIENQKIYVSDFEYFDAEELVDRFRKNKKVSADMFAASLIKGSDKLAFIEERAVPNTVISGIMRSYSTEPRYKRVICELLGKYREKENWFFKVDTVPFDELERELYGSETYETMEYYKAIIEGRHRVILKSDIHKYDFSNEKPFTRKRTIK